MRVFKRKRPIRHRFYCAHSAISIVKFCELPRGFFFFFFYRSVLHSLPCLFFLPPPLFRPPLPLALSHSAVQHGCCAADRVSNCAFKFPLHMLRKMSTARKPVQRITMRIFRRRVLSATDRSIARAFLSKYSCFFGSGYPLSSYLQLYGHRNA